MLFALWSLRLYLCISIFFMEHLEQFWTQRYQDGRTGWNIGYPSTPIKTFFDQLEDKEQSILIPGAGNAYEAEYAYALGFQNVYVLDIARPPLEAFHQRVPNFPEGQLLHADFFRHVGNYDLIVEQTFFCALEPTAKRRRQYAEHMHRLLKPGGQLMGLLFKHKLDLTKGRPFGGSLEEYRSYFEDLFEIEVMEDCYNSIKPRQGNEYFLLLRKA